MSVVGASAAPRRDSFPVVVHIALCRGQHIFLLRRAHTGFMDGWYGLPGGHMEAGESVQQAARRECLEETGVVPTGLRPVAVLAYRSASGAEAGHGQGLNFIFTGQTGGPDLGRFARDRASPGAVGSLQTEPGIAEREKFDAAGFYTADTLPPSTIPWVADVANMLRRPLATLNLREYRWD